jgi:hypothetical protein
MAFFLLARVEEKPLPMGFLMMNTMYFWKIMPPGIGVYLVFIF